MTANQVAAGATQQRNWRVMESHSGAGVPASGLGSNLPWVLQLIHEHRRISRSTIGAITGLSRSAVGNLVAKACDLGFARIIEHRAPGSVGRPSVEVEASKFVVAIAVHPEVDFLEVKGVAFNGEIVKSIRITHDQPLSIDAIVDAIVTLTRAVQEGIEQLDPRYVVVGAGVVIPGQVDSATGTVIHAPHLGWFDLPLQQMLTAQLDLPLYSANDGSLGCKAEIRFGAAKGSHEVVYLHGASGIGGGAYIRGLELNGRNGIVAEFGHIRVSSDSARDYSGIPGTVEALVRREDLEKVLGLSKVSDEILEDTLLGNRTTASTALVKRQIDVLAVATANLVNIFNPETVVLAGFLRSLYRFDQSLFIERLKEHAIPANVRSLNIFLDELGGNSVAIGAAELVFEHLIAEPERVSR